MTTSALQDIVTSASDLLRWLKCHDWPTCNERMGTQQKVSPLDLMFFRGKLVFFPGVGPYRKAGDGVMPPAAWFGVHPDSNYAVRLRADLPRPSGEDLLQVGARTYKRIMELLNPAEDGLYYYDPLTERLLPCLVSSPGNKHIIVQTPAQIVPSLEELLHRKIAASIIKLCGGREIILEMLGFSSQTT